MNLVSWALALATLILLLIQAIAFQKATVCRQEAWRKSTELKTQTLLTEVKPHARDWHLGCKIHLYRNQDDIFWQRLPQLNKHAFSLQLRGKL